MKAVVVLAVSGLVGFIVGMFRVPALQVAVESAQVVAGIVHYPPGNVFYIYHTKVWTLLHQVGALFLLAGVSELTLSRLISGLLGMAAFQALGMVVYALSRNVVLAIASAIVIVLTGVAEGVAVYPVTLMGTSDTYGALGLSLFVLVLALFAAGCHRSAALLLGLVPAVHAGLGAWLWVVTIVILVWDGRPAFEQKRPAGKFFLAGCAISAVSFAIQLVFITDVPPVDRLEVARTLNAFVSFWDYHRAPLQLVSRPMLFNIGAMAVAATGLLAFKRRVPPDATFFLEAVVVCGVLGLLAVFLSWIPSQLVPATLLMLMPSRVLTINTMVLAATVIGLSALLPRKALTTIVPVTLLAACVIYKPGLVIGRASGLVGNASGGLLERRLLRRDGRRQERAAAHRWLSAPHSAPDAPAGPHRRRRPRRAAVRAGRRSRNAPGVVRCLRHRFVESSLGSAVRGSHP